MKKHLLKLITQENEQTKQERSRHFPEDLGSAIRDLIQRLRENNPLNTASDAVTTH